MGCLHPLCENGRNSDQSLQGHQDPAGALGSLSLSLLATPVPGAGPHLCRAVLQAGPEPPCWAGEAECPTQSHVPSAAQRWPRCDTHTRRAAGLGLTRQPCPVAWAVAPAGQGAAHSRALSSVLPVLLCPCPSCSGCSLTPRAANNSSFLRSPPGIHSIWQ